MKCTSWYRRSRWLSHGVCHVFIAKYEPAQPRLPLFSDIRWLDRFAKFPQCKLQSSLQIHPPPRGKNEKWTAYCFPSTKKIECSMKRRMCQDSNPQHSARVRSLVLNEQKPRGHTKLNMTCVILGILGRLIARTVYTMYWDFSPKNSEVFPSFHRMKTGFPHISDTGWTTGCSGVAQEVECKRHALLNIRSFELRLNKDLLHAS